MQRLRQDFQDSQMSASQSANSCSADSEAFVTFSADVMEMTLLLVSSQVEALERASRQHGLTVAQMMRRLIADYLQRLPLLSRAEKD